MKKKMLKAVYGVLLSVMLVVSTATLPAQAAEGEGGTCEHKNITMTVSKIIYPNITTETHQLAQYVEGTCRDCGKDIKRVQYFGAEKHSFGSDGKCVCGFKGY